MSSVSSTSPPAGRSYAERLQGSITGEWMLLAGILLLGFAVRLLFIGADGYKNDISSFESWALLLVQNPLGDFYTKATFLDYPPGYLYVLYGIGWVHQHFALPDPSYAHLKYLVKLPAILMDLVDATLIFFIVRQMATRAVAFAAATFFALNPAAIMISAYWGQVDSVPAGLALAALLLLILSARRGDRGLALTGAWMCLAISILMKPAASALVPVFLVYPFITRDQMLMRKRLMWTGIGVFAGLVVATLGTMPFHPGANPIATLTWLYERYAHGKDVYPYNSINAFNLYAIFRPFWQADNQMLLFLPQYGWGILLFVSAAVLIAWRVVQRKDESALLEAAFLISFAYFLFPTRIHERYVFDAFAIAPVLFFLGRRYVLGASIITLTLIANLAYSLYYMRVFDEKIVADASRLMPLVSGPASALNVLVFFYLGYVFLGANVEPIAIPRSWTLTRVRSWFSPLEGVRSMRGLDFGIAGGLALLFFAIGIVRLAFPNEKIFDEIYYARAAEEYLKHMDLFEWTHPPLTKLVITFSSWLFGGLHAGTVTPLASRFMNLVVGSLSIVLVYAFAKRLLGSTIFAAIAGGMLAFDGFHFVQSRIATPEITVAFFSLLTLYAFYRYWICAQVRVAVWSRSGAAGTFGQSAAAGVLVGGLVSMVAPFATNTATHVITFLYFGLAAYLAARLILPRALPGRAQTSYAEGSIASGDVLHTFDGGVLGRGVPLPGEASTLEVNALVISDGDLRIEYAPGATMRYTTPDGEATFTPEGHMQVEGAAIAARDAKLWLWILALSSGALVASKWNGLFDFFVVWLLMAVVISQRWWVDIGRLAGMQMRRFPAAWGNPFGFPIDVAVAAMVVVSATVYMLAYIPYFAPNLVDQSGKPVAHTFADLVILQKSMYFYHHDLRATHPYGSQWWQWPLLARPISYYYHDFRAAGSQAACCVAEILALPNPLVWWLGLVSVPLLGVRAWIERNKGFALLVVAYFIQWLPWIGSPRVAFEYHFYPNLAIIILANAALLQWVWKMGISSEGRRAKMMRYAVVGYCAAVVLAFAYFYPILAGTQIPWASWDARMLHPLVGNGWI